MIRDRVQEVWRWSRNRNGTWQSTGSVKEKPKQKWYVTEYRKCESEADTEMTRDRVEELFGEVSYSPLGNESDLQQWTLQTEADRINRLHELFYEFPTPSMPQKTLKPTTNLNTNTSIQPHYRYSLPRVNERKLVGREDKWTFIRKTSVLLTFIAKSNDANFGRIFHRVNQYIRQQKHLINTNP